MGASCGALLGGGSEEGDAGGENFEEWWCFRGFGGDKLGGMG